LLIRTEAKAVSVCTEAFQAGDLPIGDLPISDSTLASETAVQSAPASSGIMQVSPRNKATKALTHWPHCARHLQAA